MKTKEQMLQELCDILESTDETVCVYEVLEALYNEGYNQGWSDCYWKSLKR